MYPELESRGPRPVLARSLALQLSRIVNRECGGFIDTPHCTAFTPAAGHPPLSPGTPGQHHTAVKHHGQPQAELRPAASKGQRWLSGLPFASGQPRTCERWCEWHSLDETQPLLFKIQTSYGVCPVQRWWHWSPVIQQPFSHSQDRTRAPGHHRHTPICFRLTQPLKLTACDSLLFVLLPVYKWHFLSKLYPRGSRCCILTLRWQRLPCASGRSSALGPAVGQNGQSVNEFPWDPSLMSTKQHVSR